MGLLVLSPRCLLTYLCAEEKGPGELGAGVEREWSKLAEMKLFFLNIEDRPRDVRPWRGRVEEAGHVLKCRSHQEPAIAPRAVQRLRPGVQGPLTRGSVIQWLRAQAWVCNPHSAAVQLCDPLGPFPPLETMDKDSTSLESCEQSTSQVRKALRTGLALTIIMIQNRAEFLAPFMDSSPSSWAPGFSSTCRYNGASRPLCKKFLQPGMIALRWSRFQIPSKLPPPGVFPDSLQLEPLLCLPFLCTWR